MDYFVTNSALAAAPMGIQSTAGAVPVRNDKGEVSMKKVKVHRYVSGKRPDYAPAASSDEESDDNGFLEKCSKPIKNDVSNAIIDNKASTSIIHDEEDPRLRRLTHLGRQSNDESGTIVKRHRHIQKPEIIETEMTNARKKIKLESSDSSDDEDLSDTEIERRREALKQRVISKKETEEEIIKDEEEETQGSKPADSTESKLEDVCTDDENDEVRYEAWKLRGLKRIKRDREEYEATEKERLEIERIRNLTEEERQQEAKLNPKVITNKAAKGKYKFLQKYYHRGAFYLDKDETILKRDYSGATLEDHFDKTVLPEVMQVKNFGRRGRTKYTHLVDQDTTQFDSPWISETAQNLKFHNNQSAGTKQLFEKPSLKKRKYDGN
ncbi:microfibrillar-associated protein 1-like [Cotesia glomerata]|uniref:microfibrillar-associated protein 1-like n=1 Tax=Cotesia glomerata TaxID=32391 RepID=UPI001D011950|nr:microfibrillar-associated protein 1-like [Cotesia glomerata]